MKTFTKILTTITFSLSVAGMANASTLVATNNSVTTKLCMTAATGNRIDMQQAIKSSRLSKSFVVKNIKCNEQGITEFVAQHSKSPTKMNALLNQSLNKGQVTIQDLASL